MGAVLPEPLASLPAAPALRGLTPVARSLEQEPGAPGFPALLAAGPVSVLRSAWLSGLPRCGVPWGSERVGMQGRTEPMCKEPWVFLSPPRQGKALKKTLCCFLPERAWAGAAAAPFLVPNLGAGRRGAGGPEERRVLAHCTRGEGSPLPSAPSASFSGTPLLHFSPASFRISLWRQGHSFATRLEPVPNLTFPWLHSLLEPPHQMLMFILLLIQCFSVILFTY